ncbi:MAG: hypothetical protein WBB85_17835 [Albidovulum sp.]|uniref:hypothetical protein n=1 Tax=Albidovulum sp. TaxID=1872424 RepID=UPI003C90203C
MIRFGIFMCFVSALYVIGQKEQATVRPRPAAIPMTLTLDETRIGAPKRDDRNWRSDIETRDITSAPAGFASGTGTFTNVISIAAPSLGN